MRWIPFLFVVNLLVMETVDAFAPSSTIRRTNKLITTSTTTNNISTLTSYHVTSASTNTILEMSTAKTSEVKVANELNADPDVEDTIDVEKLQEEEGRRRGLIRTIIGVVGTIRYVFEKVMGYLIFAYGLALTLYGSLFPTQINILSVGRAGGFNKIERTVKASLKGGLGFSATALIRSPSLVFATIAVANSLKRKRLAQQFEREYEEAYANGELSDEESQRLIKLQKRQIKLENRAIRRIKSGRNFFIRTIANSNLRELQTIFGDAVLMLTGILAAVQPTIIGDIVLRYYMFLNMGSLLLEANGRAGYPVSSRMIEKSYLFDPDRVMVKEVKKRYNFVSPLSKFFVNRLPFFTGEKDAEEVAAEELAFVRSVGSIFTYSVSAFLMISQPKIGYRINAALTSVSVLMRGLTSFLNDEDDDDQKVKEGLAKPGLLRGGNGGKLTLTLTGVALVASILLDIGKMPIPTFWTPMTPIDVYMKKAMEFATKLI